jgi:SAM-dependent methyltransferase
VTAPTQDPNARASNDDWDRHWSSYAEAASRNPAQTYRRKLVFGLLALESAPRPVRLLDLGSGQGDFARDVVTGHPDVEIVGLDLSEAGGAIASRKVPGGRFFQRDLMQPFELPDELRGWATHAVCSEVLEHVDEPSALLRHVRPFLAPGCRIVITVPGGPMSKFDRHIGHRRHFTPPLLEEVIRGAGLEVDLIRGAGFPFFNLYRLAVVARGDALIKDIDGADSRPLPIAARAAMRAFDWLFRWNNADTLRGWQLVARAIQAP